MRFFIILTLCALLILSACAHHKKIPSENIRTIYSAYAGQNVSVVDYAPLFLTYDYRASYNRIGNPSARYDDQGNEQIYIDIQNRRMLSEKLTLFYLFDANVEEIHSI